MSRASLGKRMRFEIFKRDGFRCLYCGAVPQQKVLRVDHVVAVANGGGNEPSNLVTSCFDCNAGKGAVALEDRAHKAELVTEAHLEHAEQIREWLRVQREVFAAKREAVEFFVEEWRARCLAEPTQDMRSKLPGLIERLGSEKLLDAFDAVSRSAAMRGSATDRWKYFWGVLRGWDRAEEARKRLQNHWDLVGRSDSDWKRKFVEEERSKASRTNAVQDEGADR